MTAVAVEITARPTSGPTPAPFRPVKPEPAGLVIVEDVESLAEGTAPACNDDNPYQ